MQNSTLGIWNVYHFSIESIRTGFLFCHKWYWCIKGTGLASKRSLAPPGARQVHRYINTYRCRVLLQYLGKSFCQGCKMGSLFRFMNPAISHDSVNFQRALGWHVHSLAITKIVQKLLCREARVRSTPKGKRFPQEDSK